MPTDALLIFCTCPDQHIALEIAEVLVDKGLAACANLSGPITSVFRWEGKIEHAEERLLLIKTSAARYPELEGALRALHPYELPEIIAVPIEQGLAGYLQWVEQCTKIDS